MSESDSDSIREAKADSTQQLKAFSAAIRAKEDWVFKILDRNRELARKWAIEANFVDPDFDFDAAEKELEPLPIITTIWELKNEARRIRLLDHTLRPYSGLPPTREIDFAKIDEDVAKAVAYARGSKYGVVMPELKDVLGVFTSDDLVPASLHAELVAELDGLAARDPKDYHPGTYGKVLDIIHPSLYPYVANVTPVHPSTTLPTFNDSEKFATVVQIGDSGSDELRESEFAWIPSVFRVSHDGTNVEIQSYINGLGPRERFPNAYRLIEQMFLVALPHFEKTLAVENDLQVRDSPSVKRWMERSRLREQTPTLAKWAEKRADQQAAKIVMAAEALVQAQKQQAEAVEEQKTFSSSSTVVNSSEFNGRDLKVIVKAANYLLKPGQHHKGTWHIEGMPHERILASFIYYYDTDSAVADKGLGLRRARMSSGFPQGEEYHSQNFGFQYEDPSDENDRDDLDYPSDWEEKPTLYPGNPEYRYFNPKDEMKSSIPLGTVPTTGIAAASASPTGRIVSFPNYVQHKVLGLKNTKPITAESANEIAHRKILCFFLVEDPDPYLDEDGYPGLVNGNLEGLTVLTTSDVPLQEKGTNDPTLHFLLPIICRQLTNGKMFPPELVDSVISEGDGVDRALAEQRRRGFMDDRSIVTGQDANLWEDQYSLCEH